MIDTTRREFIKAVGVAAAAGSLPLTREFAREEKGRTRKTVIPFELGMASYTFRSFSRAQALEMTKRLGLNAITLKDMHLPMASSPAEIQAALEEINRAGLHLTSCGVVYMTSEEEIHHAFQYASLAGLKMLVGAPDQSLLDVAEREVKATDIALAIHNHGPTDQRYPSPESVYRLVEKMDRRMGLCIDVGHTRRLGLDPAAEVERFADRLLDLHLKDVTSADAAGTTVEMGRGVIDIPGLLKALVKMRYARTLHFEFEKDQKDPLPGVAESVGYVRGVLDTMGS